MKTVVITGSTSGIGLGLADAFLERGCQVVVSSRRMEAVEQAVRRLSEQHQPDRIFGQVCDVAIYDQVQALWEAAVERYGRVDIWVSNAGQAQAIEDFWILEPNLIETVVDANVLGQMYSAKVALTGMLDQGSGALYIMEGKGANGKVQRGFTLYGATKRAGNFLFNSLVEETKETPIIVGSLSPGMVVTGLLTRQRDADPENWERTKKIFNILADKVDTVSPWLVDRILANEKKGVEIRYLTGAKVMRRFLMASFSKRDLFEED
jgi:NAD(P)-dependent dehydrogenase (short-subunit alcohol dehydrogenase family)